MKAQGERRRFIILEISDILYIVYIMILAVSYIIYNFCFYAYHISFNGLLSPSYKFKTKLAFSVN